MSEFLPHGSKEVPEIHGFAVGNEETLTGDLERVGGFDVECFVCERVEFGAGECFGLVALFEGGVGLCDIGSGGEGGTGWSSERGWDGVVACGKGDRRWGRGGGVMGVEGWVEEFIGSEEVGFDDVADVGPVKEVGIISYLDACLLVLHGLNHTGECGTVSWAELPNVTRIPKTIFKKIRAISELRRMRGV